jgi:hypothetical protein
MQEYSVMIAESNREYCFVDEGKTRMPKVHYPSKGIKMGEYYPDEMEFRMDDDFPGLVVPDYIKNAFGYFMVSGRLKKILEIYASIEIEFLRFTLINHKGRVASKDCFIANIIGAVNCEDEKNTVGRRSEMFPDRYDYIERLYLDVSKIDPALNLFRLSTAPSKILVIRSDLRALFLKEGITGVKYFELGSELKLQV